MKGGEGERAGIMREVGVAGHWGLILAYFIIMGIFRGSCCEGFSFCVVVGV